MKSHIDHLFKMTVPHGNLEALTLSNTYYRKVLWTTSNLQLVLMTLDPGAYIPIEVHDISDQFFRVEHGEIEVTVFDQKGDGQSEAISRTFNGKNGFSLIVPHGKYHLVKNPSSSLKLRLYTIYSPPHHPIGRVDPIQPKGDISIAVRNSIAQVIGETMNKRL